MPNTQKTCIVVFANLFTHRSELSVSGCTYLRTSSSPWTGDASDLPAAPSCKTRPKILSSKHVESRSKHNQLGSCSSHATFCWTFFKNYPLGSEVHSSGPVLPGKKDLSPPEPWDINHTQTGKYFHVPVRIIPLKIAVIAVDGLAMVVRPCYPRDGYGLAFCMSGGRGDIDIVGALSAAYTI